MSYVVAGGIVRNRDWIIGRSIRSIQSQTVPPDIINYVTGDNEDKTQDVLFGLGIKHYTIDTGYPGYERAPKNGRPRYSMSSLSYLRNEWCGINRDKATHLFVVDSDILPAPDVLFKLLNLGAPISAPWVPGCTPKMGMSGDYPVRNGNEWNIHEPFEATWVGGCYLLRKDFLDFCKWEPYGPDPRGEDVAMVAKARRGEFRIMVDPSARCEHIMKRDVP